MAEVEAMLAAWSERSGSEAIAWESARPGPPLAAVAARIASVPRVFLDERVSIEALSADVPGIGRPVCLEFVDVPAVRLGAAIAVWVLASEELVEPFEPTLAATAAGPRGLAVDALALRVAPFSDPTGWLADEERRDEAARALLLWCGRLPAGEDAATARSIAAGLDSLSRNSVLARAHAEHQHRAEIAQRLADARAREAAARYSRE